MKYDIKHCKQVERCAIVGNKTSHQGMTKIGGWIFRTAQMKYFNVSEAKQAWSWVEQLGPSAACFLLL